MDVTSKQARLHPHAYRDNRPRTITIRPIVLNSIDLIQNVPICSIHRSQSARSTMHSRQPSPMHSSPAQRSDTSKCQSRGTRSDERLYGRRTPSSRRYPQAHSRRLFQHTTRSLENARMQKCSDYARAAENAVKQSNYYAQDDCCGSTKQLLCAR